MITPLISAYFLRSHGAQPHAAWKWMDVYLKVLNWSLDTTKTQALLAKLPKAPARFGYYGEPSRCSSSDRGRLHGWDRQRTMMVLGKLGLGRGRQSSCLECCVGTAAADGATNLIGFLVPRIGTHSFASWQGSSRRAGTRACRTTAS